MEECQHLLELLRRYEEASGQAINRQKKTIFFSRNTRLEVKMAIQRMVGARIMENCEKYLGNPIKLRYLRKKITKRVMGWKEKFISKVGREIVIKTVVQAIPTYTMGLFKFSKALCDTMNSTLAKYW